MNWNRQRHRHRHRHGHGHRHRYTTTLLFINAYLFKYYKGNRLVEECKFADVGRKRIECDPQKTTGSAHKQKETRRSIPSQPLVVTALPRLNSLVYPRTLPSPPPPFSKASFLPLTPITLYDTVAPIVGRNFARKTKIKIKYSTRITWNHEIFHRKCSFVADEYKFKAQKKVQHQCRPVSLSILLHLCILFIFLVGGGGGINL